VIIRNKNTKGPTGWNLNALEISSETMHVKHLVIPHKGHGMPKSEVKRQPYPNGNTWNTDVILQK
jgi:hypothetical protein